MFRADQGVAFSQMLTLLVPSSPWVPDHKSSQAVHVELFSDSSSTHLALGRNVQTPDQSESFACRRPGMELTFHGPQSTFRIDT